MFSFNKDNDEKDVFSVFGGITFPLNAICNYVKDFIVLVLFFAVMTTVFSMLLGRSYVCSLPLEPISGVYCSQSIISFVACFFVILISMGLFLNRWQLIFLGKINLRKAFSFFDIKRDLKAILVVFIYLLLWIGIACLSFILWKRIPSENWVYELSLFVGVSFFILCALFLLFNFVVFQNFLEGGAFFAIKKTFWPIFDSIYKFILWFSCYFFFFLVGFLSAINSFRSATSFLQAFYSETMCFVIIYLFEAFVAGLLVYQKEKLFGEEK